jgi:hypothetical protein
MSGANPRGYVDAWQAYLQWAAIGVEWLFAGNVSQKPDGAFTTVAASFASPATDDLLDLAGPQVLV